MIMYGWIITKDHLDIEGIKSRVGVMGPSGIPDEIVDQLHVGQGQKWRAYDDDGELYYEGLWIGEDEYGLGPLTDFCMGDAGCTTIKVFESCCDKGEGRWVML